MVPFDLASFVIYLVSFLYWPLLYIRVRDVFSSCVLTRRRLLISLAFAWAAAIPATLFFPMAATILSPLSLAIAAASVVILGLMSKISAGRTKIKIIILAAYLHIAWQMLPQISAVPVLLDLAGDAVVLVLAKLSFKAKPKKRHQREHQENLSLSELWK